MKERKNYKQISKKWNKKNFQNIKFLDMNNYPINKREIFRYVVALISFKMK